MSIVYHADPSLLFEVLFQDKGIDKDGLVHTVLEGRPFFGETAEEVTAQLRALIRQPNDVFSVNTRKERWGWDVEVYSADEYGETTVKTRILLWSRDAYEEALIGEAFARN